MKGFDKVCEGRFGEEWDYETCVNITVYHVNDAEILNDMNLAREEGVFTQYIRTLFGLEDEYNVAPGAKYYTYDVVPMTETVFAIYTNISLNV